MKKTVIKRKEIKCEREINCKGWFDFLKGSMHNSRVGREKKEKKKIVGVKPDAFKGMSYLTTFRASRFFKHHPGRCFSYYIL